MIRAIAVASIAALITGCAAAPRAPMRAEDRAYVAMRDDERAQIAGMYDADRQVLASSRAAVSRFEVRLAQRDAEAREGARRREVERAASARRSAAHREALARTRVGGAVTVRLDAVVVRLPAEDLFWPGVSTLRSPAMDRLGRIARAIESGPPCSVTISVLDDADGMNQDGRTLAARRVKRIRDGLIARGVPAASITPARGRPGLGVQVDLVLGD